MDEKQLKALWESMSATHELGDFDAFKKNIYSDSNFRKGFWEEASPQYEIGDYKTFEDSFKKKVPLQPSQSSATPLPSQEPQKPKNPQYLTILGEGQPTPMTERQKKMPTYLGKTTNKLPNIEEAINDATEKAYKNRAVKSPVVKQQIIDSYKNGDLIPVIENGKSVMKRGAGFLKSFIDAVEENNQRNLEDSYVSTLPKDKAISYLNAKMASPETFASKRETAPSGFLGKVGEFLGENIPMLGKATAGAIAGTTLAPETGGSSFGMFLANAKDMANAGYAQNLERNYQAIKEQNPKISDSEAYDKANKAALVGEATSLATNAVLSYAAPIPKNIPTPIPSVETNGVINSLTHAIKSYPKVGGTAAAGSVINDIAANLAGNKVEASEMGENAIKSAKDMAVMHFGLWALGQPFKIPSYIRPQIENVVASAPREEVKQFYTEMENRGAVPEGTTNKVIDKLEKFDEQKQVVQNMDLSQEQQAAITGKLLQRAKIEEENRTLKKYGGSFNSKIDANQKLIDELDAQIDGITKTKDVLKFERDNVTGENPSEIGKSVEEQLKPVVEKEVTEVWRDEIKFNEAWEKVNSNYAETLEGTKEAFKKYHNSLNLLKPLTEYFKGGAVSYNGKDSMYLDAEKNEVISMEEIAILYHEAKKNNNNPELIAAVENALSSVTSLEKHSYRYGEYIEQVKKEIKAKYDAELLSKEQKPKEVKPTETKEPTEEEQPKAEPTKTLTNEEKVKQLRAEEQAEYDAILNAKNKEELIKASEKLVGINPYDDGAVSMGTRAALMTPGNFEKGKSLFLEEIKGVIEQKTKAETPKAETKEQSPKSSVGADVNNTEFGERKVKPKKVISTKDLKEGDNDFGNAAQVSDDGSIIIYHVTDNNNLVNSLAEGKNPKDTYNTDGTKREELGSGVYGSAVPEYWANRSANKYGFLKDLPKEKQKSLANRIKDTLNQYISKGYITPTEYEYGVKSVREYEKSGNENQLLSVSGQPYNIRFWENEYLKDLGIENNGIPNVVAIKAKGNFVEFTDAPYLTKADVDKLIASGVDGAFVGGGFVNNPELVIFNKDAIQGYRVDKLKEIDFQNKNFKSVVEEVKKEEVLPKEEVKVQEPPIVESIVDGKKKNVDLSKGKKAEIPKDMVFKDEKEHDRFVVDNSENPAEIASIYVSQPKTFNLSSIEMMIAEFGFTKESNISQAEQPKPAEKAKSRLAPKQDIATQARDLANKLRSGEKQILPDWLKADLPKNTKLSGISFEEAAANALETFADVYEKVKDTAQAISEALVHLRDWHKENNIEFNETEWKQKFEKNLLPKEELKKSKEKEPLKVGISHENLNKLAKKLGLKEVKRGQRLSPEEMAHRGRLLYKAGADVEQIAKDFESGMQPKADDISIVRAHIEELAKKADALEGKGVEYKETTKELYRWISLEKEMGTKASEPFTALQGERDMDTDSFTIVKGEVAKKMEKLGGINAKQERKIRELTEQNKKLKEEAKQAEKKAIEAANKTFGEGQQAQVTFTEKAKKVADNFRKLKTKEFIFRDENGNEIQVHKAGVSWNELIELGAKAIEKTGEIADGVAAIIENIKDKEWYQKLSDKDKSNLEKQFAKQFEDAVEETPEAKLIRRLQNELENLQRGIVKQKGIKIEDTPEIKKLRDEIFEAKKNLGLIKSKKLPESKVSISQEEKIINRLERELKDLEQGVVKQKAEKFEDTPKIKELKEKIFEQKNKMGLISSKGKIEEQYYGLTETPESKNLKRLEKELEDLRQGIVKEAPNKRELSNAEKELKEKIFEQKKMMGLISSKNVKDTDYGLEITLEEKKIQRLEKEKEDLENGIIKQRNVSNFKPSPEQQEKINQLTEEIKGLKENLGLIKSKQEKPLTEEEQIEQKEKRKEEIIDLLDKNVLRDLKNPKNMFSIEEKKAIWKYAKEEYLDKGVDYKEMISLVAEDLGLTWSQMNYAITTPETKKISDEMWIKQSNYRKNQNATKRWVEEQNKNQYEKLIKRISDKIRGIAVFGHGGIFVGTHAMMTLFDPLTWKQTVPAFFRAWKYAYGNKANYEIAMQELKNMDNYNMAQRAGLKNNPDIINAEEFQKSQNFLGKLGGAGEQGFNAIKVLRQDLFDYHWNKLTESEKLDLDDKGVPMAAKEIAWLVNNATGATNLKVPEWLNEVTFAGGMEMARWSKLTRNPLRASEIAVRALINPKNASTSEKVFAKVWASRVGRQLGFMASMLAVNYALQNAINPKNKVNLTNPKENDFGKFKFGDINVDMSSGMLGVTRFIRDLVFASTDELEELGGDTRMEKMGKSTIQYARGKLAPFYQKVSDIAFNTDFSGNVLPYSSDKPRQGKHKLGWTEYLWQSAPLPIAEAAHAMYESAAEHGGDPKIVDALVMAAISGGTGAKPSLYKEKQLQFSEQDKEREPFKFFVRKGVEFKELNPYKIEIEDEELGVKKPLDEYPKETIDNFKKIHKENLTESLEKIQEKGYVYIDKFGNLSISRGEGKPKEKIDLTELNKEQLKKIVSLLNSDATDKTKKEVFNQ